jgi:hypothetical protein
LVLVAAVVLVLWAGTEQHQLLALVALVCLQQFLVHQ